ncbi:tonB-dependent receptor protein [Alcanivorax jadensis T9]|uniref:TonB-dependent receptor protein n=1 Tax=Alcanivorax jadensis T9 TaxID=1177181 RepID=A0ABR4W9B0_9GAMM|nr:TonB-dependent receptor [Alcanivorax jadensis]KGD59820.1 tonB-dependent receptor protein [Alcanivorax jadensis T9]
MKCLYLTVFLLLAPLSLFAEPATLEPVTVTSTRMERPLADTPAAVTVVNADSRLRGQSRLQLDESLNRVPGLYLQNRYNFAQGLRLSSRGFGSRAPFGVRGLRLNVDGFPETLPDGQSQLDSIDLFAVEQLTVLRGPSSLFYGNATGGVVDITTQSGKTRNDSASVSVIGGNHGLKQANVQTSGRHDQGQHALSLTALDYQGFREQSEIRKYQFTGQAGWDLADTRTVTVFLTAMDTPVAQDPGGLTRQQAHQDRQQASRFASLLDAGQQVDQQRLGLHYRDDDFVNGRLNARAFISQRDFRQQLPFPGSSLIDYHRLFYGARLDYTLPFTVLTLPHRLLVGVDMDRQQDDRGRRAVSPTGNITAVTADEEQQASADGIFLQLDSHLSDRLMLTIGGRADRLRMTIDDALLTDGNDSGRREFQENSYSAGLSWQVSPAHTLYTTVSSAFESPTFTELANPSGAGGFNPDLEPQTALNREVGARGALGDRLFYEAALFRVDVDDEITPYEIGGRTFYQNAGQTRRDGLELGLEHATTDQLTLALSWTWSDFRFQEFFDTQQNADVSGKRLPGIPQHQLFAQVDWQAESGLFASVESILGGHRYAENTNRTRVGSEWLVNLRGGKAWKRNQQTVTLFAGINNLLDRDYYSNLRINANSDRPVQNRGYFEPGPGTTYYSGITLDW